MKTTTVPAQITTIEDKIAGNLTLSQLLLLISPLFIGAVIYLIVPPILQLSILKCILSFMILLVSGILAIRLKGKILLLWVLIMMRYQGRAKFYVFNKNDSHLRNISGLTLPEQAISTIGSKIVPDSQPVRLTARERLRLESVVADPRAKLHFKTNRKGALSVHITEIK